MKLDCKELLNSIIQPTLKYLSMDSFSAEMLLLGTCAQESNMGTYRAQVDGPALGIYQIEPNAHEDVWNNYLRFNPKLSAAMCGLFPTNISKEVLYNQLITNDPYSTAICRVIYFRAKEPLPDISNLLTDDDIQQLGNYWKMHYNTAKGKGSVSEFKENFKRYVLIGR
jgi:hypothetical protein